MSVHKFNHNYDYLGSITKQEAVEMIYKGKMVSIVDTDEKWRSPSTTIAIPFAVKLTRPTKSRRGGMISMNRENILRRDNNVCQYDDCRETRNLSIDHVVPASYFKNGKAAKYYPEARCRSWENLVAACNKCNSVKKKNKTPEEAGMKLKKQPKKPVLNEWVDVYDLWQKIAEMQSKSIKEN